MSAQQKVVTILEIDAGPAEAGSAKYVRSMKDAERQQDRLVEATEKIRRATERQTGMMTTQVDSYAKVRAAVDRLTQRYDPAARAAKQYEDALLKTDAAMRRGIIDQTESARILDLVRRRHLGAADAANDNRRSTLLVAGAMGELRMRSESYAAQAGILGASLRALGPGGLIAAAGIGAAAAVVTQLIGAAPRLGDELGQLRDRAAQFDISTTTLQGLTAAGIEAGVTTAQIGTAISKMTVEIGKAAVGEGELLDRMRDYAPAAAQQIRIATTQEERLRVLARAFQGIEDPAQRSALAVAAFGRSGADMGRFFAEAGGSIDLMVADAKAAGLVIDQDMVERGDAFADSLAKSQAQIRNALTPALVTAGEGMAWLAERAAAFSQTFANIKAPSWLLTILQAPDRIESFIWESISRVGNDVGAASNRFQRWAFGGTVAGAFGLPEIGGSATGQMTPGQRIESAWSQVPSKIVPLPPRRPSDLGMLSDEALAKQREAAERRVTQAVRDADKVERDRMQTLRQVAGYQMQLGDATDSVRIAQLDLQKAMQRGIINEAQYGELVEATTRRLTEQAAQNRIRAEGIEGTLAFEREQMFRSETEQRVASMLRQQGIEAASERGRAVADQIRLNDSLQETKDLAGGALKGFLSDLREGATATDALRNALGSLGERYLDKALDNLVNGVMGLPVGAGPFAGAFNDNKSPFNLADLESAISDGTSKGFTDWFSSPPLQGPTQSGATLDTMARPGGGVMGGLATAGLGLAASYGVGTKARSSISDSSGIP